MPHGRSTAFERAPKRRILILNERDPAHPRAGGAEIHVERIFGRLARRGHHVTWLATGFSGSPPKERVDELDIERHGPLPLYYAGIPFRVRSLVRRKRIDLIVECLNKVPYYSPLYSPVPTLALCHHLFGEVAFEQASWPIAAGVVAAESGLRRAYADTPFLAISPSTRADLIARGIDAARIRTSPPGIDAPGVESDPATPRPPRVAFVGRLEAYKHVDLMLRACAELATRFPELEILVIGKGSERPPLEALTRNLGLQGRTRFTGFVPDAERDALLAASRVCVFPSDKEGWGLTVIEANALGTPVVARDAPGLRDSVRHGETGLLVDSSAVDVWASAIARILEENENAIARRHRCLEWAKGFDWDRAADDMQDAMEWALAGARR